MMLFQIVLCRRCSRVFLNGDLSRCVFCGSWYCADCAVRWHPRLGDLEQQVCLGCLAAGTADEEREACPRRESNSRRPADIRVFCR